MLAIGRALMARPKLIMMDEPSMGLAPLVVKDIFAIIRRLAARATPCFWSSRMPRRHCASPTALRAGERRILLEENAEDLLANRDVQRAYLGRDLDSETD